MLAVACGGAAATRPVPATSASPSPTLAVATGAAKASPPTGGRRVTLRYELHGKSFPLPLVHGTVAGAPTWMLVDTGANSNVIAAWLARQVGLPLKKLGDLGADHAGRTIATYRVDHAAVTIDEWGALADIPLLATEVPTMLEELGIGMFVSPQRLVEGDGGSVVLDFPVGEMRAAHYDEAVHKLGRHGTSLAPNGGRVCEDDATPIQGLAFVLPATVEGRGADLLVDTGAQRTDLLANSAAGKALASRSIANKEQLYAASGRMMARLVRGATVSVGDYAVHADIDLIPGAADPFCPRDGVVSMDVLRSCVLVLGKTSMAGRCGGH